MLCNKDLLYQEDKKKPIKRYLSLINWRHNVNLLFPILLSQSETNKNSGFMTDISFLLISCKIYVKYTCLSFSILSRFSKDILPILTFLVQNCLC